MKEKYKIVKCRLDTRSSKLMEEIQFVAYKTCKSSGFDPYEYLCLECSLQWLEKTTSVDINTVFCPNCYSPEIRLTKLRLWYPNWTEEKN